MFIIRKKKKTYLEGKRRRTNCLFGNTFFISKNGKMIVNLI